MRYVAELSAQYDKKPYYFWVELDEDGETVYENLVLMARNQLIIHECGDF